MENETVYEVKPKFNLIYEMFMPTGKKIRNTISVLIIFIIGLIIFNVAFSNTDLQKSFGDIKNIKILDNIRLVFIFLIIIIVLKLIIHISVKLITYSNISYTFYKEYLEYKDSFLNQHVKTMQYCNIKEIEIIRTVFDRIMGYGVIVIHTNAENENSNGLILYSIKNAVEVYKNIDDTIHKKNCKDNIAQEIN